MLTKLQKHLNFRLGLASFVQSLTPIYDVSFYVAIVTALFCHAGGTPVFSAPTENHDFQFAEGASGREVTTVNIIIQLRNKFHSSKYERNGSRATWRQMNARKMKIVSYIYIILRMFHINYN